MVWEDLEGVGRERYDMSLMGPSGNAASATEVADRKPGSGCQSSMASLKGVGLNSTGQPWLLGAVHLA